MTSLRRDRRRRGPVKRGIPATDTAAALVRQHGPDRALAIAQGRHRRAARYNPRPEAAAYYAEVVRFVEEAQAWAGYIG